VSCHAKKYSATLLHLPPYLWPVHVMTRLAPKSLALEGVDRQEMPSSAVGPVPLPPRHLQNITTTRLHHPTPPLSSAPSPSSLLLLSTSTTDPSLFSFDIVRKLNQEHLATIPPNPYSAISVAQHQQQQQSQQVRRFCLFCFIYIPLLLLPVLTWLLSRPRILLPPVPLHPVLLSSNSRNSNLPQGLQRAHRITTPYLSSEEHLLLI
jgi:hypothetical protein